MNFKYILGYHTRNIRILEYNLICLKKKKINIIVFKGTIVKRNNFKFINTPNSIYPILKKINFIKYIRFIHKTSEI